jgi:hypothetical protein
MKPQDRAREWALKIFHSQEAADRFMRRPSRLLGGKAPIEIARTHQGANWVIEQLTDAAYGCPILPSKPKGKAPRPPGAVTRLDSLEL